MALEAEGSVCSIAARKGKFQKSKGALRTTAHVGFCGGTALPTRDHSLLGVQVAPGHGDPEQWELKLWGQQETRCSAGGRGSSLIDGEGT